MQGAFNFDVLKPCDLPEKVATGFSEVFSKLVGADYVPVLYCGKQTVHGVNHMIICKIKVCHPDASEKLAKVILNQLPKDEISSHWSIVSITEIA
ncbi:MAG: hypothetical protein J1F22_04590 [Lachnospiraceae bacterium]|nr:hypothetical protein [Lachnospiraceae bacterium]